MSELRSPVQAFIVRKRGLVSNLHLKALFQLYQPIVGSDAINFYLLLDQQSFNEKWFTSKKVHSSLFSFFGGALGKIDQARLGLEAIGLLQTYKETNSDNPYPTLLYDLQLPLLFEDFVKVPILANQLIHQLGEHAFYAVAKEWQIGTIELSEYDHVSVSFDTVFHPLDGESAPFFHEMDVQSDWLSEKGKQPVFDEKLEFDFASLLRRLMQEQLNHQSFGPSFKDELAAIYYLYRPSQDQLVDIVVKSYDKERAVLDHDQLRMNAANLAKNKQNDLFVQDKGIKRLNNENLSSQQIASQGSSSTSLNHTLPQESLIKVLKESQPKNLLVQIKINKNGFVSDQEFRNLESLQKVSSLPSEVINFMIYYVLIIKERSDFQKGESQRLANEWQQKDIDSIEKALTYIQKGQEKITNSGQNSGNSYYNRQKKKEIIPYWMNNNRENQSGDFERSNQAQAAEISQVDQEKLRQEMKALLKREEGHNENTE